MIGVIRNWFQRNFSDPEAVLLIVLLSLFFFLVLGTGYMLLPLFVSIMIAYFLAWIVRALTLHKMPRLASVWIVYLGFLGLFFTAFLVLWPLMWRQTISLINEMPAMLNRTQAMLYLLPDKFPEYITKETIDDFSVATITQIRLFGKHLLSTSIASISNIIMVMIYLVLVPLLVFFLLKDSQKILDWFAHFLPPSRPLLTRVSQEVDEQIGNYIRGKIIEVFIVGIATYLGFFWFKLKYSILLASLVGLSVLIPYVGAVLVTIPVIIVGFFQWGLNHDFVYMLLFYAIIQGLDANVVVPILFSEAVNLHPIAIITAILIFGGLWGAWGVFFAIPLAILVKAILNAWPSPVLGSVV